MTRVRTAYQKILFMGERLSASEIGRRHGLSPVTILNRQAKGLVDRDLVAPPGSLARAKDGEKVTHRSQRLPSVLQALARLRRAKATLAMAFERLVHAKAMGEHKSTIKRLERERLRAEQRRLYCTEMVRVANELAREKEEAAA